MTEQRFLGDESVGSTAIESGVKHAYDGLGRRVRTVEFEETTDGVVTVNEYDRAGRLTEVRRGDGSGIDSTPYTGRYERRQTTYDLAGRVLTEKEIKDSGSLADRETTFTHDGADRIDTTTLPPRSGGDTREIGYSYGFDGSEETLEVTDANDAIVSTAYNVLGQVREESVSGEGGHIANGNTLVEFYYGGTSTCGCGGAEQARFIKATGGHYTTTVERTFDARGKVTEEIIQVGSCPSTTTEMTYNEAGWRTHLTYPDAENTSGPPEYTGTTINNDYKSDGRVLNVEWLSGTDPEDPGDWTKVMDFQYRGSQVIEATHYYADGSGVLAELVQTFDDNNYVIETAWTGPSGSPDLARTEYVRNGAGYLTAMMHPTSDTTENWMHFTYEGPHWLESFSWYDNEAGTAGDRRLRTYTRNGFGERDVITETGLPDQDSEVNDWVMKRDDAGHYIGENTSASDRVLKYNSSSEEEHAIRSHAHVVDKMGQRYQSTFTFDDLGASCGDEDYTWDYEFDAWGRVTGATRQRVCGTTYDYQADYKYQYDGLGRLVYRSASSQDDPNVTERYEYLAYENDQLITTIERNGSCLPVKLTEAMRGIPEYPPPKERERPGKGDPDPDDEEMVTVLLNACGEPLASNVTTTADGEAEVDDFVLNDNLPTGEALPIGTDFETASEGDNTGYYLPGYLTFETSLAPPGALEVATINEFEVDDGDSCSSPVVVGSTAVGECTHGDCKDCIVVGWLTAESDSSLKVAAQNLQNAYNFADSLDGKRKNLVQRLKDAKDLKDFAKRLAESADGLQFGKTVLKRGIKKALPKYDVEKIGAALLRAGLHVFKKYGDKLTTWQRHVLCTKMVCNKGKWEPFSDHDLHTDPFPIGRANAAEELQADIEVKEDRCCKDCD